jgi:hypothetical protein
MTHTPSGGAQGFTGEVYFHYDNAGNTSLLTNASGAPLASFQHDALSGMLINEWNPQNIVVKTANIQRGSQNSDEEDNLLRYYKLATACLNCCHQMHVWFIIVIIMRGRN